MSNKGTGSSSKEETATRVTGVSPVRGSASTTETVVTHSRRSFKFIALACSLVIAFIFGEVAVRIFHAVPDIRDEFPGFRILYQNDADCGYSPRPNVSVEVPDETGRMVKIHTDANGLRMDSTVQSGSSAPAIGVLGDSFIANLNTDDNHTMCARLSQQLNNRPVLNFGVLGFSNVQELAFAKPRLPKYPVNTLVMAICACNDLIENLTWTRGTKVNDFEMNGKGLLHRIARKSDLLTLAYRTIDGQTTQTYFGDRYDLTRGLDKELIQYDVKLPADAAAEFDAAVGASVDALSDFKRLADQMKARRLVVLIPAKAMVYREILFITNSQIDPRADLALGTVTHRGFDFDKIRNTWSGIAHKAGVPFLDLTDLFRAHSGEVLYGQVDRHWNAHGQQLAAQAVAQALSHGSSTMPVADGQMR